MPTFAIVEAPSNLGLRPTGVETLPAALLGAGFAARLGARHAGQIPPLPYDARRDPETGMLNPRGIRDYSPTRSAPPWIGASSRLSSAAIGSGRAAGLEVTIFNPRLDPGGRIAADFVNALAKGLSSSSG